MGSEVYTDAVGCFRAVLEIIEKNRTTYQKISDGFRFWGMVQGYNLDLINKPPKTQKEKAVKTGFKKWLINAYKTLPPLEFYDIMNVLERKGIDWQKVKNE